MWMGSEEGMGRKENFKNYFMFATFKKMVT